MRYSIFLIFLISTLCFLNIVNAQNISIIVPGKPPTIYASQSNEVNVMIKNGQDIKDTFYFSIWPTKWVTLERYWASFEPGEIKTLTIDIIPPKDAEEGTEIYTLTVKSLSSNLSSSQEIYVNIKRTTDIFLSEIKLNKQSLKLNEILVIQPVITNVGKETKEILLSTQVLKDNSIVKEYEDSFSIGPESVKTFSYNFPIERVYTPGDYVITVFLKDSLNRLIEKKSISFTIQPTHKIEKERESKNFIFYTIVNIRVTNKGNVKETNLNISESLPLFSKNFFLPDIEPMFQEEKNNRIVYKWLIELEPGETKVISYRLRFTNVIMVSCILIVIIVWVGWLFYQPKLLKGYKGIISGKEEITISLYIKNRRKKSLNNIIVKDFVPAIATVVKKFDTLAPKIRRKAMGTELLWKIKQLKPKEERILTYRIKPVVEVVGELRLPKATLTYETKKGKRRRVLSKKITITGKIK